MNLKPYTIDDLIFTADEIIDIDTFPNHLHDGAEENVIGHEEITGIEVLRKIIKEIVSK